MIQFFALIPRAAGVSSQEFHDHWRHPHGTMGRNIPSLRSYVQSHHVHCDLLSADQSKFEGIAESTFDTVEDAAQFGNDPYYKAHIQPDEPNFVDGPRLEWLNTEEEVLVSRGGGQNPPAYPEGLWLYLDLPVSIKLLQFVRSDGNPDWAGEDDAELGRRIGALRHVRNRPVRSIHGDTPPYLGVRQLWWPTLSAFNTGAAGDPEAFQALVARGGAAITLLAQAERFLR
ncbi:EthD domain-containing protein [Xanthomonas hortorum]|uniref:EthD domain-containing protein n=1 Tax=Xanthomonas hortorum TaxID=56454 RepID=UPI0015946131|nr:EthD domain-containing protein [Xanthomonas hortorum]NHF65607.1 EthD family reductase [Xanthomonas hortorum]